MSILYNRIAELCATHNISGYRLCREIGIQPSILTDLKSGRKKGMSAKTASKIASYFDVTVGYLLGEDNPNDTESQPEIISIEERTEQILSGMTDNKNGTLMLDGAPISEEALAAFRIAVQQSVELARKLSKQESQGEFANED